MRIIKIKEVCNAEQLDSIYALMEKIEFQNGEVTASGLAKAAKKNTEAVPVGEHYQELVFFIQNILKNNYYLQSRLVPKFFSSPLINCYKAGDKYGRHYDVSHMQDGETSIRKDYSFTLMLSKTEAYAGGDLEIEINHQKHRVQLNAGDMVVYPSNYIHSVLPISHGERLAYIGWISSHVKDPLALEVLNAYEDLHVALKKYDISDDDKLSIGYVKNKLRHLISD